jgi:signal transduction histidine kinase
VGEMTLTTRLTAFALAGLAVVLAGFSLALYLLVAGHEYRQLDNRLEAALNVLTAAAEVSDDGVEWEPAERRTDVGEGIAWHVTPPGGRVLDSGGVEGACEARWSRERRIDAPAGRPPTGADKDRKFPALVVHASVSVEPVESALGTMRLLLVALSVGTWLTALVVGRTICRWALRPVTRMAAEARGMDVSDLGQRLPVTPAGDELTALADDFNALLGRVQEAFERQRRFTGDASHQLRTPLAAVLGQVEVALRRDRSPEEYRQTLQSVHRQADRLRKIVEALLFLARADADARLPDRERLDLGPWLTDHVRTAWADHPRAADLRVEAEPATATAHPVLLGELVNVLLDNACKFSPAGTPIVARVGPAGAGVELSVTDAGSGIAAADIDHIFEPFVRSDDARRRGVEGLRLGLAVAQRIARAHGGTLTATSPPGAGTTVALRLPSGA